MYFGERGECQWCGRELGTLAGKVRYHRDDGEVCKGAGMPPKDNTACENPSQMTIDGLWE